MPGKWEKQRVLIVVRTYPVPARKGVEVSCTAGVTKDGKWIRLFLVPYRFLQHDQRFTKYQWIEVDTLKAGRDSRPESFNLNVETLKTFETISTADNWRARREILRPLMRPSMCAIKKEWEQHGSPTLGLFKPGTITRLILDPDDAEWTAEELAALRQTDLFQKAPKEQLEKIPYGFKYEYTCSDAHCTGHTMTCFDWEIGQSFRSWRAEYGDNWESKFRQRYEADMIHSRDTHFFVGNMHQYPGTWIIVGLFYPPRQAQADLFGS
jgi:hypothetical protein